MYDHDLTHHVPTLLREYFEGTGLSVLDTGGLYLLDHVQKVPLLANRIARGILIGPSLTDETYTSIIFIIDKRMGQIKRSYNMRTYRVYLLGGP